MKKIGLFLLSLSLFMSCKKDNTETYIDLLPILKSNQALVKTAPDSNYYVEPSAYIKVTFTLPIESVFSVTINGNVRAFKSSIKSCELFRADNLQAVTFEKKYGQTMDTLIIRPINPLKAQTNYSFKVILTYQELTDNKLIDLKDNKNNIIEQTEFLNIITSNITDAVDCSLSDLSIFNYLNIENDARNVNLDTNLLVNLKYLYNKPIKVKRGDSTFFVKALINNVQLWNNSNNTPTKCSIDTLISQQIGIKPVSLLEVNSSYFFSMKITYLFAQNGTWQQLLDENNNAIEEIHSLTFGTTGTFDLSQFISFTYPIDRQLNFYKGEYPKGYFLFRKDMAPFFEKFSLQPLKVKFSQSNDYTINYIEDFAYNTADSTAWFNIPSELQNNKIYKLEVISNNKAIHTLHFRCSYKNKISEKFTNNLYVFAIGISQSIFSVNLQQKGENEYFDSYETAGSGLSLLSLRPWLDSTVCFGKMKELYRRYTNQITRDKLPVGIPPKNVYSFYKTNTSLLSDDDIADGDFTVVDQQVYLFSKLTIYLQSDYDNFYVYLMNHYSIPSGDPTIDWALTDRRPRTKFIGKGNYPFFIDYVLPGKGIVTSTVYVNLINNITLNF